MIQSFSFNSISRKPRYFIFWNTIQYNTKLFDKIRGKTFVTNFFFENNTLQSFSFNSISRKPRNLIFWNTIQYYSTKFVAKKVAKNVHYKIFFENNTIQSFSFNSISRKPNNLIFWNTIQYNTIQQNLWKKKFRGKKISVAKNFHVEKIF